MRLAGLLPALAAGLLMLPGLHAAETVADGSVREVVEERVTQWWPTAEEKKFDQIGWAQDIRAARALAAKHDRPVFLFTMDGG